MKTNAVDEVTVLMSWDGIATKRITRDDTGEVVIHEFSAGKDFNVGIYPVDGIFALSDTLTALEDFPKALVIRGDPVAGPDGKSRTRRLMSNFLTPAEGRRWVMLDLDKIPLPKRLRGDPTSSAVREHVISLLPREFHDASYHWQLSSSAGFRGYDKVSFHFSFWLDRYVHDRDLKRWAKKENKRLGYKLIDPALFHDVQAHYTAAPIFEGVENPFPLRSGLVIKKSDEVKLLLPPTPREETKNRARPTNDSSHPVGFENWLTRIGDHEGGDGFHDPIIRAAASYVATNGASGTDVEALYERIRDVVLTADASRHDPAYIERMAGREHIVGAIEGAIKKFGHQPSARRKSRRIDHVDPYYPSVSTNTSDAVEALDAAFEAFFTRAA